MKRLFAAITAWLRQWRDGWNWFWYSPSQPHALSLIRVLTGWMLFYTHLTWALDLESFLGADAWLPTEVVRQEMSDRGNWTAWSHLYYIDSPPALWTAHVAALVVFFLFTIGYKTRVTSILAWLLTVAYCNRLVGALFGLDQLNTFLSMYLALGPSGDAYSWDAWRRGKLGQHPPAKSSTTVAIRMIQLHMCLIYLFSGIGKMRGATWWNGTAMWYSLANQEYQTADLTWLAPWWPVINGLTHLTVFWEMFYCALIWPKLTRPITLACAVLVHGGIMAFLGMPTFGFIMLVGNVAFVNPEFVRRAVGRGAPRAPSAS